LTGLPESHEGIKKTMLLLAMMNYGKKELRRPSKISMVTYLAISLMTSRQSEAAEGTSGREQHLQDVEASRQVASATWNRQADNYKLQIVLDRVLPQLMGVGDPLNSKMPPNTLVTQPNYIPNWPPNRRADSLAEHGASDLAFIPDVIANLRKLELGSPCDLIQTSSGREGRWIEVWLLTGDGRKIPPISNNCEGKAQISVSYEFDAASVEEAVSIGINIDKDSYTEKLQPLDIAAVE
jgi:hypothetical protein